MHINKRKVGHHSSSHIFLYTLYFENQSIEIINYGATVTKWLSPDRDGKLQNIVLGRNNWDDYFTDHPNFGCIIGRYANRINNGRFRIEDQEYQLPTNLGPHHLHGGPEGFGRQVWNEKDFGMNDNVPYVKLSLTSPDGDQGYPGTVEITVEYRFSAKGLEISYIANTDQATILNPTSHIYFNLSGDMKQRVFDHVVQIDADFITQVDEDIIPTGALQDIRNTSLDFNIPTAIGVKINLDDPIQKYCKGFDHNYILNNSSIHHISATVLHPNSGRKLTVCTSEPAIQLYTGNHLGGVFERTFYLEDFAGFCLETQHYPDSPNHAQFPSTLLRPGDNFESSTIYRLSTNTLF